MLKKIIVVLFVFTFLLFSSCSPISNAKNSITKDNIKVGFVYNGFINDEGYTQAHDAGRKALNEIGIPTMYIENIKDEDLECYEVICDMIDEGCNVIYGISYGFLESINKAADDFPNVIFGHCSGIEPKPNLTTYFGKMFQARYLAGIVAGLKTKSNKIGYVAAYKLPECIRGINAFTLGVQSVNPNAKVYVSWTNTWYDPIKEKQGAMEVLEMGCDVIEQHQDTPAAQLVAQDANAFCIGYNYAPEKPVAPGAYLCSPIFHWEVFILDDVNRILNGTWESRAYWEGLDAGVVDLSPFSALCTAEMNEKVYRAKNRIINGDLKIFSGELFDADGKLRVTKGNFLSDDEIWNMDWFVNGVVELESAE